MVALFFVPLLFRLPDIYHWAAPGVTATDPILLKKAGYLNVPFFIGRAVLYFAIWTALLVPAEPLLGRTGPQRNGRRPWRHQQVRVVSAPGLLVYSLTITFAAVDWIMSIDAHWYSTIFGLLFLVGQGLSAFAFVDRDAGAAVRDASRWRAT